MEVKIYKNEYKTEWDSFVENSKNGTFLLKRDFIEYHGDRFKEYSMMFYVKEQLVAILAGHTEDDTYYSHKGLTYAGLIMDASLTAVDCLAIFTYLAEKLKSEGIKKIIYKAIPHIYHQIPAEEDLYALFRLKAKLVSRQISSTIQLPKTISYNQTRKNGLKKSWKANLSVRQSEDFETFWEILEENLQTNHNAKPVHSPDEIKYLKRKFLKEINLYAVFDKSHQMQAACVSFEMPTIIHAQYTASSDFGKKNGAIDLLIDTIIKSAKPPIRYFDYGTSTEKAGLYLNENLIYQKEGFGARGIVYDTYEVDLTK